MAQAIERVCRQCGRVFQLSVEIARRPGNRYGQFCSRTCNSTFTARKRWASHQKLKALCLHCGVEFLPKPADVAKGCGKFCSRTCATSHRYPSSPLAQLTREERQELGRRGATEGHRRGTGRQVTVEEGRAAVAKYAPLAWEKRRTTEPWPRLSKTKLARRAYDAVRSALKSGRLVRPDSCQSCGTTERRIDAHHDDYEKPLDVKWVCRSCHFLSHLAEVS